MCFSADPPKAPPPPAAMAPMPLATVQPSDGNNRKDSGYLNSMRGRNSLRIDRTQTGTGSTGTGLNIPS